MSGGRVLAALVLTVLAAAIASCGGGDDPQAAGPGPDEAEATAREFLAAGVNGDTGRACGLLSDDLTEELESTFPCETLVEVQADLAKQGTAEFDSVKIDSSNVEELALRPFVSEDGQFATVTGPTGEQTIGLEVLNGEWVISALPDYEQPG